MGATPEIHRQSHFSLLNKAFRSSICTRILKLLCKYFQTEIVDYADPRDLHEPLSTYFLLPSYSYFILLPELTYFPCMMCITYKDYQDL